MRLETVVEYDPLDDADSEVSLNEEDDEWWVRVTNDDLVRIADWEEWWLAGMWEEQ